MAQMHGTMEKPVEEADDVLRRVAGEQGWAYVPEESKPDHLVFHKGFNWFTWGSKLEASLTSSGPGETGITIRTSETFGMADWGRGKRGAVKLLEASGATII